MKSYSHKQAQKQGEVVFAQDCIVPELKFRVWDERLGKFNFFDIHTV